MILRQGSLLYPTRFPEPTAERQQEWAEAIEDIDLPEHLAVGKVRPWAMNLARGGVVSVDDLRYAALRMRTHLDEVSAPVAEVIPLRPRSRWREKAAAAKARATETPF